MQKKLSFLSVLSLVIGSQIGSGVFLLPSSLAGLGPIALFGWLISGTGAVLLALVFARLSLTITKGGGPYVYVEKAFGREAAFFTAWTYWLISWVSSIAVIVAAVGYLSTLLSISNPAQILWIEILIISAFTFLNLRGASVAGSLEIFLTIFKCLPLIAIPLIGFFFLDSSNFFPLNPRNLELSNCLNTATLMTFWGFIGLETATTTAGIIDNPSKTIPRAILFGTLVVAFIYLFNSYVIMGIIPNQILSATQAPYALAIQRLFGGGWNLAIAFLAFITCLGTLNAWILTSGQIAVEASKDGLFPSLLGKTNRFGAPHITLLIILGCMIPLLCATSTPNILEQLNAIIDISVLTFVFIYMFCALSFIKLSWQNKTTRNRTYLLIASFSILFCLWIIAFSSLYSLFICSLFVLSGLPIYLKQRKSTKFDLTSSES